MRVEREDFGSKGRFVLYDEDRQAGEMTYAWAGDTKFIIDHTGIEEAYGGKGYGKILVKAAVDFARQGGFKILPLCPFAKAEFDKNSDYADVAF